MDASNPQNTHNLSIPMAACPIVQRFARSLVWLIGLSVFVGFSRTTADDTPADDHWFTIQFDQKPVGYERILVRAGSEGMLNCQRVTRLQLRRLGQDLSLHATLSTIQKKTGELLEFELRRSDASSNTILRSGIVDSAAGVLILKETQSGTRVNRKVPIRGSVFSPIMTQWLPVQLLTGNQRSRFGVLFPETSQVSEVFAERKLPAKLRIGQRQVNTLRANFFPSADATRVTKLWLDADGALLQSEKRVLSGTLKLVKTTASEALSAASGQSLDLDAQALIPTSVSKDRIPSSELILDLTVQSGLAPDVPDGSMQRVERLNAQTIRIRLLDQPAKTEPPAQSALASHPLLPLDAVELQRMAKTGASAVGDDLRRCQRLESYVRQSLSQSPFSTQFIAADKIARRKRGDCTEHATLLCALLRCSGIPARLASGLVTIPQRPAMAGHVWVEAYVDGAWQPFDSSLRSSSRNIPRIKLADESFGLPTDNGMRLFIPILEIAGRATVEIVSQ